MDGKVGKEAVPLYGGHGKPGGFHVIEHLGKDAKVKRRCAEGIKASHCPGTDKQEKGEGQADGKEKPYLSRGPGLRGGFRCAVPAPKSINHQHPKHQGTGTQKRPGRGCRQCSSCIYGKSSCHPPALCLLGTHNPGQAGKKQSDPQGKPQHPDKGHGL